MVKVQGRNLPFNPTQHIDQHCRTAIQRCRLIGTLANREWGWHPKRLRAIYLALVRSVLSFAAAGWVPWISADAMKQLVRADNRALRIVSGLLNTAPVETIAIEAGVQDLKTHYDYLIGKSWISAQCLPQQHPRSLAYRGNVALRTRREDWRTRGRDVCNLYKIGKVEDRLSPIGSPPWLQHHSENVAFCWDLSGRALRSESADDRKNKAVQTIRRLQSGPVIFTDGSCVGGTAFGGSAAVIWRGDPEDGEVVECLRSRGRRWTCSFDTEIAALGLAASYIASLDPGLDVLICSDCASAIKALARTSAEKRPAVRDVISALHSAKRKTTIVWIPAHCGIFGNEKADVEAGAAAEREIPRIPAEENETVALATASALLKARTQLTTISHLRSRIVFDCGCRQSPYTPAIENRIWSKFRINWPLAQLRSGYCSKLATYSCVIKSSASPNCPHCKDAPETVEH